MAAIPLAAALLLVLAGCGGSDARPGTERGHTFVGKLMKTDAYIAIVASDDGKQVAGYVTDGKQISIWIGRSALKDGVGALAARNGGEQVGVVAVSLSAKEASGSLVIDNEDYTFAIREAKSSAGLYHAVERANSIVVAETGWVRLDDGTFRGTRTTKTGSMPAGRPSGSAVIWDDPDETYPWHEPQSSPVLVPSAGPTPNSSSS